MKRIRVPLVTGSGGIQAAMPSFVEIPGSYQGDALVVTASGVKVGIPLGDARLATATVQVEVPDEDVDAQGNIDKAAIKRRYPDHFLVRAGRFD